MVDLFYLAAEHFSPLIKDLELVFLAALDQVADEPALLHLLS